MRFPDAPPSILKLRVDRRGFPVPAFVRWFDGEPDFRVMDPDHFRRVLKERRCWTCGEKLGRMLCFPVGPMCVVNRISAEPPSHPQCARFAAQACPFLTSPLAKRPEHGPAGKLEKGDKFVPGGKMLERNPGVVALWFTLRYAVEPDGRGGMLFSLQKPERVEWWARGRLATREEAVAGLEGGLEVLRDMARKEGAEDELEPLVARALPLLPA